MKLTNIVFFIMLLLIASSNSFADSQKDCSKYLNDTLQGTYNKWKCDRDLKQGKQEKKFDIKNKLKKIFKKKS